VASVARGGERLRILLEPTASPLRAWLWNRIRARYPRARIFFHGAAETGTALAGAARIFGRPLAPERCADLGAQTHAAQLGMWIFLVTERLLFSTLFVLYAGYRVLHPRAFAASVRHTDLVLGTINTYVLSTTAAREFRPARSSSERRTIGRSLFALPLERTWDRASRP
jgi:hypothetical protein